MLGNVAEGDAVSQLTTVVIAPAEERPVGTIDRDGAAVVGADAKALPASDDGAVVGPDLHQGCLIAGGGNADLAVVVEAAAPERVGGGAALQAAAMMVTRGDAAPVGAGIKGSRSFGTGAVTIGQLTVIVESPAMDDVVFVDGAAVGFAGSDQQPASSVVDFDRTGLVSGGVDS